MSFVIFASLSIVSIAVLYYFFFVREEAPAQKGHGEEPQQDENDAGEQRQPRRGVANRLLRNRNRQQMDHDDDDNDGGAEYAGQGNEDDLMHDPDHKLSKKEIQKMQKRQEKQRMQDALKQQKEEREQRRLQQEQKEQEQDDLRKEEERLKEEEENKLRQEIENKEKEEYNQWKDMFTVEEAGDKQEEDLRHENILAEFIEHINIRKVVLFEDLAAEFSMTSKDVIDRIQRLQAAGRLQGITDDRGKFIHITDQEQEAVSRYIKSKGRVNKAELLMECNKLIRLQPKNEDKIKIKEEQKNLLSKVEKEFAAEEQKA